MDSSEIPIKTKLQRLEGLIDTNKVSDWENQFLSSLVPLALTRAQAGQVVGFTGRQLQVLNDLFDKHFAA